ncbi:MAG: CHASE2 domain-containing protein, partial [Nitrospirae bacterium]
MTSFLKKHSAFVLLYLSVSFFGGLFYFLRPSPLMVLEKNLYDLRFSFVHRPPAEEVVVVAVDEKSIDKMGRWPWPRKEIKKLLEKILSFEPAVVGLDIVFSEASTPEEDSELAELIESAGNVVTGFFFRKDSSGEAPQEESLKALRTARIKFIKGNPTGIPVFTHVEVNIPEIQAASFQSGFFNFFPDPDGLYRRLYLLARYRDDVYPCLALSVLQAYYDEDAMVEFDPFGVSRFSLAERFVPAEMDSSISLNFYGPKGGFRYISASDVLEAQALDLKDRIVLVGVTELGLADLRPTPVDATLPGVALHATFISNFLKGDFIVRPTWAVIVELAFIFIPPFIIIFLSRHRGLYLWMGFGLLVLSSETLNIFLF